MNGFAVAIGALRNPRVLAAQAGFALYAVVEHGTWLTLLLYAFERGGVGEAGIVAFALTVPAAIVAPFGAAFMDRLQPARAFATGFAPQAVSCALIAVALLLDGPPMLIYGLGAVLTAAMSLSRPTLSAALPTIANTPAELSGANAIAGFIETAGVFVGPATTGFILVATETAVVFAVSATALLAATALALTIKPNSLVEVHAETETESGTGTETETETETESGTGTETETETLWTELMAGFALLRDHPEPRLLVMILASTWIVFGALDVAMVAIAVDQLGRDAATAGLLAAAVGAGGVAGSVISLGLSGRRRQSVPVVLGLLSVGLFVMLLSTTTSLPVVFMLLAMVGLGDIVADVSGRTLIQGLAAEDTLARVFGVLEGLATAALAVGGLLFSSLVLVAGIEVALIVIGAMLPTMLVMRYRQLLKIDRARPTVDVELLALLRQVPIFAPLPAFRVEQLIINLGQIVVNAGQPVFVEGDSGDLVYLVSKGTADVELSGRVAVHKPGSYFGEIALLRQQPRMATVRAGADGLTAYTLERTVFLQALSDFPRSRQRTAIEAKRRLDES